MAKKVETPLIDQFNELLTEYNELELQERAYESGLLGQVIRILSDVENKRDIGTEHTKHSIEKLYKDTMLYHKNLERTKELRLKIQPLKELKEEQ